MTIILRNHSIKVETSYDVRYIGTSKFQLGLGYTRAADSNELLSTGIDIHSLVDHTHNVAIVRTYADATKTPLHSDSNYYYAAKKLRNQGSTYIHSLINSGLGRATARSPMPSPEFHARFGKAYYAHHTPCNITGEDAKKVDAFNFYLKQVTREKWFKLFVLPPTTATSKDVAYKRITFQQQLYIESILNVCDRYQLQCHKGSILFIYKTLFGLKYYSPLMCEELAERLNSYVSVSVVPRQSGKTTFTRALIALLLTMTPGLGLSIIYICLSSAQSDQLIITINNHSLALSSEFNTLMKKQYDDRMVVNKNIAIPGDFYYDMTIKRDLKCHVITIVYQKHWHDENGNPQVDKKTVISNTLRAIIYLPNSIRGSDATIAYIDEGNYYRAKMYAELMAIAVKNNFKTFIFSSQCGVVNDKGFVDITAKHRYKKHQNNIVYVCFEHAMNMILDSTITQTKCFCRFFAQPRHITIDPVKQAVITSFTPGDDTDPDVGHTAVLTATESARTTAELQKQQDDAKLHRINILAEIGEISSEIRLSDLVNTGILHKEVAQKIDIISKQAFNTFYDETLNIKLIRDKEEEGFIVLPRVYIYIDPAGIEHSKSKHGMAATAILKNIYTDKYTACILAAEEFNTNVFANNKHMLTQIAREGTRHTELSTDKQFTLALMVMRMIKNITILYNTQNLPIFTEFIIMAESVALSVNNMWTLATKLRYNDPEFITHFDAYPVEIYSTVRTMGVEKKLKTQKLARLKRVQKNKRLKLMTATGARHHYDGSDYDASDNDYSDRDEEGNFYAAEGDTDDELELHDYCAETNINKVYNALLPSSSGIGRKRTHVQQQHHSWTADKAECIGYVLGSDKTDMCYKFMNSISMSGEACYFYVQMSSLVMSDILMNDTTTTHIYKNDVRNFIIDKLSTFKPYTKRCTSTQKQRIVFSGKGGIDSTLTDDVTICLIVSANKGIEFEQDICKNKNPYLIRMNKDMYI